MQHAKRIGGNEAGQITFRGRVLRIGSRAGRARWIARTSGDCRFLSSLVSRFMGE
jgi:hypothetical protein